MTLPRRLTDVVMPLESDVDRPVEHRATARVLLLSPDDRVLLLEDSDPTAPGSPSFWITPGGGIEAGESPVEAAVRELAEETGIALSAAEFRGPVAARTVVHGYSDTIAVQDETYFVARAPGLEVTSAGLTDEERQTMRGHRWWSSAQLRASTALIWPVGVAALVAAADDPARWPAPLSVAEESTVAAGWALPTDL